LGLKNLGLSPNQLHFSKTQSKKGKNMRFLKNFLMSIGVVALAAALVNLLAPQAVHAAVAALVQVSNPATSPALTSRIDDPGRIPYQKDIQCQPIGGECAFQSGPVPANHRLVVQHISGEFFIQQGGIGNCRAGNSNGFFSYFNLGPAAHTGIAFGFDQLVQFSVDQNQVVNIICGTIPALDPQNTNLSVTGYLLDCNAGPCVALANF
jgi:hypothetical protein